MGLNIPAEPNGQTQTLYFSVDGGAAQSAGTVLVGSKKFRIPTLSAGSHVLRFWLVDAQGASSPEASVTVTIAANTYTRTFAGYVSAASPGTVIWDEGAGIKHAPEILELKARVNQIRAWYGLAAIALPYESTEGSNTIKHFHTWMPNMQALYQGLADTGAVSGASIPARETRTRNAPNAGVINQIRSLVGSL